MKHCAERLVQPRHGADAFQRPLRSRFQARLTPAVMEQRLWMTEGAME
jgi:hypothetical protein